MNHENPVNSLETLPIEELRKRAKRAIELAAELKALFPDLIELSELERKYSQGRMRRGEPEILSTILDAVEMEPSCFKSLAGSDEHGSACFETAHLRERLERRALYQNVADALVPLTSGFKDTALHFGGSARPAIFAAYRIAKTVAQTDERMRAAIGRAVDFFRLPVRRRNAPPPSSRLTRARSLTAT